MLLYEKRLLAIRQQFEHNFSNRFNSHVQKLREHAQLQNDFRMKRGLCCFFSTFCVFFFCFLLGFCYCLSEIQVNEIAVNFMERLCAPLEQRFLKNRLDVK